MSQCNKEIVKAAVREALCEKEIANKFRQLVRNELIRNNKITNVDNETVMNKLKSIDVKNFLSVVRWHILLGIVVSIPTISFNLLLLITNPSSYSKFKPNLGSVTRIIFVFLVVLIFTVFFTYWSICLYDKVKKIATEKLKVYRSNFTKTLCVICIVTILNALNSPIKDITPFIK